MKTIRNAALLLLCIGLFACDKAEAGATAAPGEQATSLAKPAAAAAPRESVAKGFPDFALEGPLSTMVLKAPPGTQSKFKPGMAAVGIETPTYRLRLEPSEDFTPKMKEIAKASKSAKLLLDEPGGLIKEITRKGETKWEIARFATVGGQGVYCSAEGLPSLAAANEAYDVCTTLRAK